MTTPFPFTAGQTLTAAQLNAITTLPINDQTASYTLVVGDVGKRVIMNVATANTVTVNNSIFAAGDTIFIANKGAGTSTITAGAGVTINSASGLALPQYQSGQLVALSASTFLFFESDVTVADSGLTLISSTTIGSAVSSVTVSGAFSATYENYLVTINGGSASGTTYLKMTLGSTTANYYYGVSGYTYAGVNSSSAGNNVAFMFGGSAHSGGLHGQIGIYGPQLADETVFTIAISEITTSGVAYAGGGFLNNTTQYTAFTLTPNAGTITGGTIRVYGYKN